MHPFTQFLTSFDNHPLVGRKALRKAPIAAVDRPGRHLTEGYRTIRLDHPHRVDALRLTHRLDRDNDLRPRCANRGLDACKLTRFERSVEIGSTRP